MQLYSPAATACRLYSAIAAARGGGLHQFAGWPATLPLLSYGAGFGSSPATTAVLSRTMSFDSALDPGTSDELWFVLAKFALNGSLLGVERLTSQLLYCGGSNAATSLPAWLRFGWSGSMSATCALGGLLSTTLEPAFYDLYVRDLSVDQAGIDAAEAGATGTTVIGSGDTAVSIPATLYPVPVRLVNYRDAGGAAPNVNRATADEANDVLTARFMLWDSVSGVTAARAQPEVLRYATAFRLTVNTRANAAGHPTLQGLPVLTITYVSRLASGITAAGATGAYGSDTISFAVEYAAADSNAAYGNAVVALAATLGALVLILAAVSLAAWVRNNARDSFEAALGLPHLVRFILAVITSAAPPYFWFCWIAAAYWLVFFKLQTQVYALLPAHTGYADDPYLAVTAAIATVWVCYTVRLAALVAAQVTADVFIIDWERPRGVLMRAGADHEAAVAAAVAKGHHGINTGYGGAAMPPSLAARAMSGGVGMGPPGPGQVPVPGSPGGIDGAAAVGGMQAQSAAGGMGGGGRFPPISVWRTLMAARAWNELATARRTSVPLTLILLVALLQGAGLQYVATWHPGAKDLSPGPLNSLLQFANTVFWFLVIVVTQLAYQVTLGERFLGENPTTALVDRLTVAKVSLLLLDARYHGFYVHANAPHEFAGESQWHREKPTLCPHPNQTSPPPIPPPDGDMRELSEHLGEEAAALRAGRGLPGSPEPACQTFELHLPGLWRQQYDRVYRRLLDQESEAVAHMLRGPGGGGGGVNQWGGGAGGYGGGGRGGYAGVPQQPGGGVAVAVGGGPPLSLSGTTAVARMRERTRRLHAAFTALAAFLRAFIDETDPDYKRVWRERTLLQTAFGLPPDMLTEALAAGVGGGPAAAAGARTALIMPDRYYRVESLVFRGIEWDLLLWEVLSFCLVDHFVANPALAGLATWLMSEAVAYVRRWLGARNVAYKTLIDERFL